MAQEAFPGCVSHPEPHTGTGSQERRRGVLSQKPTGPSPGPPQTRPSPGPMLETHLQTAQGPAGCRVGPRGTLRRPLTPHVSSLTWAIPGATFKLLPPPPPPPPPVSTFQIPSPLGRCRGEEGRLLTWVRTRWSVGCRGSGPHCPRHRVSRTRSPFWHAASAPPRKSSRPQPGGPWGRVPGQPSHSPGAAGRPLPGALPGPALPLYLLCPTATPGPVPSAHLSVDNFHSSAVAHGQHPGVGREVCPTPGGGVPEHEGVRVLVDLLQPWGDRPAMGGGTRVTWPRVQDTVHGAHGLWSQGEGGCLEGQRTSAGRGRYPSRGVHRQTAPERLQTASSPGR